MGFGFFSPNFYLSDGIHNINQSRKCMSDSINFKEKNECEKQAVLLARVIADLDSP